MLKGKGRKRRKISREEKLENARHRALQKLGEEEAADVLAVFQKASDAGDKEQADGIIMTLLAQSLSPNLQTTILRTNRFFFQEYWALFNVEKSPIIISHFLVTQGTGLKK